MSRLSRFFSGGGQINYQSSVARAFSGGDFPRETSVLPIGHPAAPKFQDAKGYVYMCHAIFFNYGYPGARCMFWGGGNAGCALLDLLCAPIDTNGKLAAEGVRI